MKLLRTKAARIYGDIIEKSRPEDEDSRIRHPRMPIPDRAKIFAPFAALTGYEKVIDQKSAEALLVPRPILAEDKLETLSQILGQIRKGQTVQVAFFRQETTGKSEHTPTGSPSLGVFCTQIGAVSRIDTDNQLLTIDGTEIPFQDILELIPVPRSV